MNLLECLRAEFEDSLERFRSDEGMVGFFKKK